MALGVTDCKQTTSVQLQSEKKTLELGLGVTDCKQTTTSVQLQSEKNGAIASFFLSDRERADAEPDHLADRDLVLGIDNHLHRYAVQKRRTLILERKARLGGGQYSRPIATVIFAMNAKPSWDPALLYSALLAGASHRCTAVRVGPRLA